MGYGAGVVAVHMVATRNTTLSGLLQTNDALLDAAIPVFSSPHTLSNFQYCVVLLRYSFVKTATDAFDKSSKCMVSLSHVSVCQNCTDRFGSGKRK